MTHTQAMEAVRSPSSFRADWLHHAQAPPLTAHGLGIATLTVGLSCGLAITYPSAWVWPPAP